MAFDQPLESDRIDDSGLFSTLIRNPVAGVIMWALGEHKEKEDNRRRVAQQLLSESNNEPSKPNIRRVPSNMKAMHHALPSMVASEMSETRGSSVETLDSLRRQDSRDALGSNLPKKQLSWSDDIGQKLVQYQDQVSLIRSFVRSMRFL